MTRPDLVFFRELRVSEPRLGRDRSTSTYTFVDRRGRRRAPLTLHYKFPAPLYRDADERMRNHARVHHAVVALNYGLFCERIVYDFPLTGADLAYLRAMEDATAREQYLNRFVGDEPHALIRPEFHVPTEAFEPEALDAVAQLVAEPADEPPAAAAPPDPRRYAVLSSGGKESLLTYGLLRELGEDVSPVYLNESGRHWYTALMAHRHHARAEPRTRRIWTSVDRVYVGANRLLPCVRPDFQRIGADVYPVQLFTFNSYQMAVAGLCMHEGIGTMLMGNEFDEGPWPEVKGVKHWYGIYDQSQEFDLALNAYFGKKRWGLRQTSLLRPLSSLVIQDLLATRYPDLARVQTSCHATTLRAGRVVPCGRCSKCLGVLLFLLGRGHDPRTLRYRADDVRRLGERLAATRIKVDQAEAEHAMWLAARRGWTFQGSANGFEPRPHPEVQAVRFHPEMSRRDAMPRELAERVYRIFSARTEGVLEKKGARWRPAAF
ncbi:MAG TPA: hypothetical protein VM582_04470 [Candidatus Thermoplasmatota archaeon]|nr:hypothetical protein [Candidatus Thermoplasmatota archaeon]